MKKNIILSLILIGLLISVVSAEIIINEQPKNIYNLGDTISIPVKIKSLTNTYGIFQMNLICNGKEINFYKNGISLIAGEEKNMDSSIPLIREILGDSKGICRIKSSLLTEYVLTGDFVISDIIEVKASTNKNEFKPEEEILITGNGTKESGSELNGFVEVTFSKEGAIKINQTEIITNGRFSSKVEIPKSMEAGEYVVTINAYEKDSQGKIINKGFSNYAITISQIPTSLEIFFEQKEVLPGDTLRVKAILHDQTGEKINALAVISIKNEENNLLGQVEEQTDNFIEYKLQKQQLPGSWKIVALSSQITNEASFIIKTQEKVDLEIINKTVIVTNTGNVFYNKKVLVTIGTDLVEVNTSLAIGESKKYYLNAPNGEYQVKVLSSEGEEVERSVMLTGNAISVKEVSEGAIELMRRPFVWVFIAAILGFVLFLFFKKRYKKSFIGNFTSKKNESIRPTEKIPQQKNALVSPKNKAHLSLSIQGAQQKASIVCIKLKNHLEVSINKSNAKETLQKIVEMAENVKASIYENNESIFFLFTPLMTKTFQNEVIAADLAQSAKKILDDHNRLFKQKIHYGISAEHGEIIAKKVGDSISFTGMGQLMITTKKLASLSQGEVFVGEKLKEKIQSDAKLEKHNSEKGAYYIIKELKDKEKHQKFLSSFVKRQEKENKINKEPPKEKFPKPEENDFEL